MSNKLLTEVFAWVISILIPTCLYFAFLAFFEWDFAAIDLSGWSLLEQFGLVCVVNICAIFTFGRIKKALQVNQQEGNQ